MSFTEKQIADLAGPLDPKHVAHRQQGGSKVSYIEGWHAIAEANRIFGFGAWTRETVDVRCVSEREREVGRDKKPGWGVSYSAKVRVTVYTPDGVFPIMREGCGVGHGIDVDLGQAHESALKEAETDAMKRALMTFGNPFGLALYDKSQANVQAAPEPAITDAQHDVLKTLMDQSKTNPLAVCEHYGIASINLLPASKYEGLRKTLSARLNPQQKAA